ncbi:hypothetical protein VCR29J2_980021 [Vibrio coralliirubri]|nr:hypothetical protein VCR29J2_980021 [Vibrio coralliirubri]
MSFPTARHERDRESEAANDERILNFLIVTPQNDEDESQQQTRI